LGKAVIITGRPGVGKTTVFLQAVDSLRVLGLNIGGFVSREVRVTGNRVGFEIMDLTTRRKGWLAHVDQHIGPKVGKYRVNTDDLVEVGVGSIQRSLREDPVGVIAVDEIGPMELTCSEFVQVINNAAKSTKTLLATVHYRERSNILHKFGLTSAEAFEVTLENRETINYKILDAVIGRKGMSSSGSIGSAERI
jgi:nucleoside-triphosphatase